MVLTTSGSSQAVWLEKPEPIAGVPGPGRWLVFDYAPVAVFSLKASYATSAVGKTLVVPTPYAVKMSFVDAAFRAGQSDGECSALLRSLVDVDVRLQPPTAAVVSHTFVKVRQEVKDKGKTDGPYLSNIAYREFVHHVGNWRWAFDLARVDAAIAGMLVHVAPHVRYIGKRGSFIQYVGRARLLDLGTSFTRPVVDGEDLPLPAKHHFAQLDDFGPEASMDVLSSYSSEKAKAGKHRRFVPTLVPLGRVNSGPGFTEYAWVGSEGE